MLNYDPQNPQYDLRSELGVYDCAYVETDEIKKSKNYRNDLRVIQLNIRGLINKQRPLINLINHTEANVVLLCETWLSSSKESCKTRFS